MSFSATAKDKAVLRSDSLVRQTFRIFRAEPRRPVLQEFRYPHTDQTRRERQFLTEMFKSVAAKQVSPNDGDLFVRRTALWFLLKTVAVSKT